jgi:uncharacterized protein (TIGR03437 family)
MACAVRGQGLPANPITGKYHVHHLVIVHSGGFQDMRSLGGSMTFDGNGSYTFTGIQMVGAGAESNFTASGTYSVNLNGTVTLSNPQRAGAQIQAKYGRGMIVGSSVEAGANTYDLFAGVPAADGITEATINSDYWVAGVEFVNAAPPISRATFFSLRPARQVPAVTVFGQATNLGTKPVTQTVTGASTSVNSDGTGGLIFPLPQGATAATALVNGQYSMWVGAGGTAVILASKAPGSHGFFVGVRADAGVSAASVKDLYMTSGLQVNGTRPNAHVGMTNVSDAGVMTLARRVRAPEGAVDFSGVNRFSIGSDGQGLSELNRVAFGGGRTLYVGSGVSTVDSNNYELVVGVRVQPETAPAAGPYISRFGAVNAASFAPAANPVSPGGFVTLFGARLAGALTVASNFPFPTTLGGSQVLINGTPVPLYSVSPTQVSALVPYATASGTARVAVVAGGVKSEELEVRVAATAPGVFSTQQTGFGPGAILKADYSLVTASNRARRGDVVQVYLTGLGKVTPAVSDGAAASTTVLSTADAAVNVYVGGVKARVLFKGLAPGFAGLYQLNVEIPLGAPGGASVPLGIETPDAFHDQVDVAIEP